MRMAGQEVGTALRLNTVASILAAPPRPVRFLPNRGRGRGRFGAWTAS